MKEMVPREKDLKRKEEFEKEQFEQAKRTAEEEKQRAASEEKLAEVAQEKAEEEKAKEAQLEAEKEKLAEEKKQLEAKLLATEAQSAGQQGKHLLHRHGKLRLGDKLISENGLYTATLQSADGNFVLADSTGATLWTAATNDTGARELIVQKDNNVVIYDQEQRPQWATGTEGNGTGNARLVLQDDGNLVLKDEINGVLWATNTNQ